MTKSWGRVDVAFKGMKTDHLGLRFVLHRLLQFLRE